MDDETFDDIFLRWQSPQFDANIEFPVDYSTVDQIFPDDILETTDSDIAADVICARLNYPTVINAVPNFPSQNITAGDVPNYPKWDSSASGDLQAAIPRDGVLLQQPASYSMNSASWGISGTTSVTTPRASSRRKSSIKRHIDSRSHKHVVMSQFYSNRLSPRSLPNREEHVLRERKRRDNMAEKLLLLEKLLPPQARRLKVEIVEDTIKLVKRLRLRKDELVKRSAKLKLTLLNYRNKSSRCSVPGFPSSHPSNSKASHSSAASTLDLREPILDTPGMPMTILGQLTEPHNYLVQHVTSPRILIDTISRNLLQIRARVSDEHEILVEMLFRQYSPNLHARVVQTVETMKLELIHGSIQRSLLPGSCQFIKCIITAIESDRVDQCQSSRRHQDTQSSARLLVAALQAAFGHVQL